MLTANQLKEMVVLKKISLYLKYGKQTVDYTRECIGHEEPQKCATSSGARPLSEEETTTTSFSEEINERVKNTANPNMSVNIDENGGTAKMSDNNMSITVDEDAACDYQYLDSD